MSDVISGVVAQATAMVGELLPVVGTIAGVCFGLLGAVVGVKKLFGIIKGLVGKA